MFLKTHLGSSCSVKITRRQTPLIFKHPTPFILKQASRMHTNERKRSTTITDRAGVELQEFLSVRKHQRCR